MIRTLLVACWASALLAAAACGGGDGAGVCEGGGDFDSRLTISDHLGNTDRFASDRSLELEYSFTNCRQRTIHLLYPSNAGASFSIDRWPLAEGGSVSSQTAVFYDYGAQDAVGPGETVTRMNPWIEAPEAQPGEYQAHGALADCHTEPASPFECPEQASVRFTMLGDD